MRVAMFVTGERPFGRDWAAAASTVADVLTIETVAAPTRSRPDPTHYELPLFRPRPKRMLGFAQDAVMRRRVSSLLTRIAVDHGSIDVVHTHYYAAALATASACRSLGLPLVHTEHSSSLTPLGAVGKLASARGLERARTVFKQAAVVVAVSEYLARSMRDLGLPGRFEVIGNPVDTELFRPAGAGRPGELVTVARLEADKGLDVVLRAVAALARDRPAIRLTVVGGGPDSRALEELAARLGLEGKVTFTGRVPRAEVASAMSRAAAFTLGSRVETFGMAAAEAIAAGVPVVVPRVGALPELVDDGCGRLVAPDDAEALAAGLADVLDHPDAYDSARMSRQIERRYSRSAVGRRLAAVYADVSGKGG